MNYLTYRPKGGDTLEEKAFSMSSEGGGGGGGEGESPSNINLALHKGEVQVLRGCIMEEGKESLKIRGHFIIILGRNVRDLYGGNVSFV